MDAIDESGAAGQCCTLAPAGSAMGMDGWRPGRGAVGVLRVTVQMATRAKPSAQTD